MTKTILVPIDFSIASLNTLKVALNTIDSRSVNVILLYAEILDNSITGLLFYSRHKRIAALSTPGFEEALAILRNRFETLIASVEVELFHGYTVRALNNFLEAKRVDVIYVPEKYRLRMKKDGYDPLRLLKRTQLPVIETGWAISASLSEKEQLHSLFN